MRRNEEVRRRILGGEHSMLISVLVLLPACSDEPTCVDVDPVCEPLYEPTFDNVYERTFSATCSKVEKYSRMVLSGKRFFFELKKQFLSSFVMVFS